MNIGTMFDLGRTGCRAGGHRMCGENQIRLSLAREKVNCQKTSLCFTVGKDLMQQMRWFIGDRVTLEFDPVRSEATIRRIAAGENVISWMLTTRNSEKGASVAMRGQIHRSGFSITARPMMLEAFGMDDRDEYIPETIITSANGITFPLAKQWTVKNGK